MKHWTRWTKSMDEYLKLKFAWIGDAYLAELFERKFPKHFPWTKKHIEKRRWYLKLKRTSEAVHFLRRLNNKDGRQLKMWDTRGRMKEGEIREWNGRKYIKVKGKVMLHARYLTKAKPGQVVRTFEGGLKVITRRENQLLNAKQRASLPYELKQTVKVLNKLKKVIHVKENRGFKRDTF